MVVLVPLLKLLLLGRLTEADLIKQVHYLTVENRILRRKLGDRVLLTPRERQRLIRFGVPVGEALKHLISIVQYPTFRRWLKAQCGMESRKHKKKGRPPTKHELKELVLRMAKTPGWGYSRILGELRKLGIISVSRTTIRSILKRHGIEPAPDRDESPWAEFLQQHKETLWSCDFFTKNVLTMRGIKRQTVLVFMHIASRKVIVTKATEHPNKELVSEVAEVFSRMVGQLNLSKPTILVRDNDGKFACAFDQTLKANGVEPHLLPLRAPLMNAYIERWIKSLKVECLDQFLAVGASDLDDLICEYVEHYHTERPHKPRATFRSYAGEHCQKRERSFAALVWVAFSATTNGRRESVRMPKNPCGERSRVT